MRVYYDFHIHSALSPCADNDMTPCNIVNMARLKGLDAIAVTDHNSIKNAGAVMQAGKEAGILVIPGMEIETKEEVHVLSLFPSLKAAEQVWQSVAANMPEISNRHEIFGKQLVMDEKDNVTAEEGALLVTASSLSINEVFSLVKGAGGAAIPAHVDREAYSVLSNLGFIPDEINASAIEVSKRVSDLSRYLDSCPELKKYKVVSNSDAHFLGDISERKNFIDIFDNKPEEIVNFFR